ncbi:hypothetical protein HGP28_08925 [Vibrio sp. SM6]|uniref:Uncharacterized protein n=1 Tax=Vibrio agarilyticus TaxID=2726741 RepID=A0A7X8TQQ3_9VIBR|nr:HK97-gp10 family putative phage morphogenesis protein [Vibrio agarilyticus]NLS13009.1 hypothetical protein [Vibrio agarilyticus]
MIDTRIMFNGFEGAPAINEVSKSLQYFDPKPAFRKGKKVYKSNPLQNDIRLSLKESANILGKKAAALAPKQLETKEGLIHLKDSIKVRVSGNKAVNKYNDGVVAKAKVTTSGRNVGWYAAVVEWGRDEGEVGAMDAQPFMVPAIMAVGDRAISAFYQSYTVRWNKRAKALQRKVQQKVKRYKR